MKQGKTGIRLTNGQVGFLLVVPGLAIFAGIILYPFISAIIMSFTDRTMLSPEYQYIGLQNYRKVFADPYFMKTVRTTVVFVIFSTLLPFTLGFIWAILLNQGFKGSEFLRGVTLVNWIIPGTALACVVIARTWQMLPWYMAFLLGGLQGVSLEQVEAARVDGANNWQVFWYMVLPSMKTIAFLVLILGTIGNLQHFDLPWTVVQGGPARATTTLSIEVYTTAFKNWNMGKAATIGTIWAVLLALFSFVYLRQVNEAE